TGVATGFTDLDRLTAGFQRGDLVIVAARPSMGKTALALNVVQHAAIEHNVGIAVFSLEMSKEQLVQRLLCSEGLVDAQRLRRAARASSGPSRTGRPVCRTCGSPGRSSRTPTSCVSASGRSCTTAPRAPRRTKASTESRS